VAVGRGMSFSGLKTEWLGFDDGDWGSCNIDGMHVCCVEDLRVLGFRFGRDGSMDNHVKYWTTRGLEVRGRIGAIARRFGGVGGIGAWEMMRLVQGAYLPVVEYGLEFVAASSSAVHRIEVHVRDCLRSLFRMPLKLANNILHSECGIPPTGIRAAYYQGRCAQRFLNHGYCANFPWTGSIRNSWCLPGMTAVRMESTEVLATVPRFHIAPDKETGMREAEGIIASLETSDTVVGFVDGSNKGTGCGCAWVGFRRAVMIRSGSCGLPVDWDINSCELFAILSLLRDMIPLSPRDMVVFSDSQFVVMAIQEMRNVGESSGIWQAFAPLLSQIPNLTVRWIPGHRGILGNEITDWLAKRACGLALEPGRFKGVDFGFGGYARVREQRLASWRSWHAGEGHTYYRGVPNSFGHMKGLRRLDMYAVVRIRSGTGLVGHDRCDGKDSRFHWTDCSRYEDGRPDSTTLFDNRRIGDWVTWIRRHDFLGLGIPSNAARSGNVCVAFGNPFDGTACIIRDGRYITIDVAASTYACEDCGLVHSEADCPLPTFRLVGVFYFLPKDFVTCPACRERVGSSAYQRGIHFGVGRGCRTVGQRMFWHGIRLLWDRFTSAERVKLAMKWLFPAAGGRVQCPGCQSSYSTSDGLLNRHLRLVKKN